MLTVGDKFPTLTLPVQQGTDALPNGETIDLAATNGKWKVLFYWPKDFTFICPTEIIGYGDLKGDFADRDAVLIGASTDTSARPLSPGASLTSGWRHAISRGSPTMARSSRARWASCTKTKAWPCARPSSSIRTMSSST